MWTEAGVSGGGVASPGDPTVPPHGPEWALPLIDLNATSDQARAAACPCSDRVSTEPQSLRDVRRQVWQAGCSYFSGYTTKKPSSGSSANGSASLKAESSVTVGRQSSQGQPWD